MELLVARNPDADSTLPYLLRLPLGRGLVSRAKATWPRPGAVYCPPAPLVEWPDEPEIVERVPLRACARRGAAIDVVADRSREQPVVAADLDEGGAFAGGRSMERR